MEGILVYIHYGITFTDGTDFIANVDVLEEIMEDCDDDFDQKVCCECSYEEDTYSICNHVYEYQQMQMKETKEHIDKDDDRSQEGNAKEKDDEENIDEILINHAEQIKHSAS